MKKQIKLLEKSLPILFFFVTFFPLSAFAQAVGSACPKRVGLDYLLCKISDILGAVLPVLVALGVVYLVWGIVQYFIYDNEEAKTKGKERIIFGIIGLAVIIGLWGLVNILDDTFELSGDQAPSNIKLRNLLPR